MEQVCRRNASLSYAAWLEMWMRDTSLTCMSSTRWKVSTVAAALVGDACYEGAGSTCCSQVPGDPAKLTVLRNGEEMEVLVHPRPLPSLVPRHLYEQRPSYYIFGGGWVGSSH